MNALEHQGTLPPALAKDVRDAMDKVSALRQRMHSAYGGENDTFRVPPPKGRFTFGKSPNDEPKIENNRFADNHYTLGANGYPFAWANGPRSVSEWQAYGQDLTGSFSQ